MATEFDARRARSTVERLAEGRERYVNKCSGCHVLQAPGRYSSADWRVWVGEMAGRALLSAGDRELILEYLGSLSAGDSTAERSSTEDVRVPPVRSP